MAAGLALGLVSAACGCSSSKTPVKVAADATSGDTNAADTAPIDYGNPDCDPLVPGACAMPWPSNLYLKADSKRKTGYTLQFAKTTLPQTEDGRTIDPTPYARLDGYSVGTSLLLVFPLVDLTLLASETDLSPSVAADAHLVWLEIGKDAKVKRHIPYFAELDAQEPDAAHKTLYIRPGVILEPATRYVIGIRGLKDKDNKAFAASPAFAALQAGTTAGSVLAPRQARFDEIFGILKGEGLAKADLQLAWDFVTASDDAEHAALLKLRDDAFAAVGAKGPELTVTEVIPYSEKDDADIALEVTGTMHVPSFLESVNKGDHDVVFLHRGADGLPVQNGWVDRPFYLRIPRNALGGKPQGLVEYGHGLNGHAAEVESGYIGKIANANNLLFFACHMTGMSQFDLASIINGINIVDEYPTMPDKLHQGMVEYLLLARAMRERLADLQVIKDNKITINKDELFYFGNSQGGIYGGTVLALSQDTLRGDFGVVGSNYSILLQRSKDFETFFAIIRGVFADTQTQSVLLMALQLLWDPVDPVTNYRHLSLEPYPNTPVHAALFDPAKGDYQVANVTNEIVGRSGFGIQVMKHYGKTLFGVTEQDYPFKGSGIVLWDFGNPWAPPGNVPPPATEAGDPHEKPRRSDAHTTQMVHFFRTGEIIDVCGGDGCTPD